MTLDTLMLRRHFQTTLDFDELKDRLKRRIGLNYMLGHFGNEEISLYFLRSRYTNMGLSSIPYCKIEIIKPLQTEGQTTIRFGIAGFALIWTALIPMIFMAILYFSPAPLPFFYALGLYPFLYLVLQSFLTDQFDKFKWDLGKMETGIQ